MPIPTSLIKAPFNAIRRSALVQGPKSVLKDTKSLFTHPKETLTDAGKLNNVLTGFSFMAPAGNAVFGPLLLNQQYKNDKNLKRSDEERRNLVFQEAIGQSINLLMHWTSFLIGRQIAVKALMHFVKPLKNQADDAMVNALKAAALLAANIGSFVGMSFVRPVISAKLLNKWGGKEGSGNQQQGAPKSGAATSPQSGAPNPFSAAPSTAPAGPAALPGAQTVSQPQAFQNFTASRQLSASPS